MITGRLMKNPIDNKITFDMYLGNKSKEPIAIALASSLQIVTFDDDKLGIRVFNDFIRYDDESIDIEGQTYSSIRNIAMFVSIDRLYVQNELMELVKTSNDIASKQGFTDRIFSFKGVEIKEE